jgi:hypothetical protein
MPVLALAGRTAGGEPASLMLRLADGWRFSVESFELPGRAPCCCGPAAAGGP